MNRPHHAPASSAADLARLKLTYGPRWHITTSIPGLGPRTLTATETGTGRRLQARNEAEMETRLQQAAEPASSTGPANGAECPRLCR